MEYCKSNRHHGDEPVSGGDHQSAQDHGQDEHCGETSTADGRIKLRVSGREIDVRVSIIPMLHGEGVVMRVLDKSNLKFDLRGIGMPEKVTRSFRSSFDFLTESFW